MRRLRRVISKQSTAGEPAVEGERETAPFLSIDRWPLLGRRRDAPRHRPSQSFSIMRALRSDEAVRHKRTSSSSSVLSKPRISDPAADFLGYPPGGLEVQRHGLVLRCEQRSPDTCQYTVRRDSAGLRLGDVLAIALISWAAHVFFRGHVVLALLPMALYLARSALQVCQESLIVVRSVGIQVETVTLAGFRRTRSYEAAQISDLVIHEALQLLEYRYFMAILPRDSRKRIIIMFPHLLPRLDELLPVYHGARRLLFS